MGGLIARYYLRYGTENLNENGSLPQLSWAGSKLVEHLVVIGTPNADTPEKRREIALDHLHKSLWRAKQFTAAMDVPAIPPPSLHFFLVAGDSENTDKTAHFDGMGRLSIVEKGPGDDIVLRRSALMDERRGNNPTS